MKPVVEGAARLCAQELAARRQLVFIVRPNAVRHELSCPVSTTWAEVKSRLADDFGVGQDLFTIHLDGEPREDAATLEADEIHSGVRLELLIAEPDPCETPRSAR